MPYTAKNCKTNNCNNKTENYVGLRLFLVFVLPEATVGDAGIAGLAVLFIVAV